MKLQGLAITLPLCDLRPFVDPKSRLAIHSAIVAEKDKTYIKGFGRLKERKLWIPWRPADTVYYDSRGAIILPDVLPVGTPVTRAVRRVYLDGTALVRFEFAIFTPVEHNHPKSNKRLHEFARLFWEQSEFKIIQGSDKLKMTLATALPKLVKKFVESTSPPDRVLYNLCQPLGPLIQVIAQASTEEISRDAQPVDKDGKIFLSLRSLKLRNWHAPIDTAYLTFSPEFIKSPPGEEFKMLQKIRARIAWLHADIEILTHILQRLNRDEIDPDSVSDYLSDLARGLREAPSLEDTERQIVLNLMKILKKFYGNRISVLIESLKVSGLPNKVKYEVAALFNWDELLKQLNQPFKPVQIQSLFEEPIGQNFHQDVFKHSPLLRYYSKDPNLKSLKPFENKEILIVLHFFRDLLPFIEGAIQLGLNPESTTLFYKEYPYPQKMAVANWLKEKHFRVLPRSKIPEFLNKLNQTDPKSQIMIIEDGGFFVPEIHRNYAQLINDHKIVGAVEQTTRGIMNAKDWINENEGNQLRFPVLSIATSKLKAEFEPPYIARAVIRNIERLLPNIALNGKKIGLFGCGTIGKEIAKWLRTNGADTSIYEPLPQRQLWAQQKGFYLAGSPEEAARGKSIIIGCSGRRSINSRVIANLAHGTYIISASSEQYEIDVEEIKRRASEEEELRVDYGSERLIGTDYIISPNNRRIHLLCNGYPINFWGMDSMPDEASDLIMTLIFLAAVDLARGLHKTPEINDQAVDELAVNYKVAEKFLEFHIQG